VNPFKRRPTATLFAQLLALVVLSLVGASVINIFVIFNLPPQTPNFYRVSEVAQVLRGVPGASQADRRPLVASLSDAPPSTTPAFTGAASVIRQDLAGLVGVDPSRITIEFSRFYDRREFGLARDKMVRDRRQTEERLLIAPFKVGLHRADGKWLIVQPKPTLRPTRWQQTTLLWLALSTLVMTPIAYLFARRLAAPIALFAVAAERLGRDPGAPPLAVRGPAEIGVAVRAFNDMQERLARYVDDRTAMVGAVAHDLRTPLTRLRFRVEAAPDELRAKMSGDIAEMEAMISGVLAFVRDATRPAERTRLELSSLLESLADEMSETGLDVVVEHSERVVIDGDPVALRRLFNNLLDNAVKFGGLARARVFAEPGFAIVEIEDRGCGLPEAQLDRVFEPFFRHEASRSRETGGIGLGLAVVRSIARAHGGDATLSNREGGGLIARVKLPT
jgi:two-component system OmpR family sensor kinase